MATQRETDKVGETLVRGYQRCATSLGVLIDVRIAVSPQSDVSNVLGLVDRFAERICGRPRHVLIDEENQQLGRSSNLFTGHEACCVAQSSMDIVQRELILLGHLLRRHAAR